jgi:hypothetical protein
MAGRGIKTDYLQLSEGQEVSQHLVPVPAYLKLHITALYT